MFTVPYQCPVTQRFWDAGRALNTFDGETPDVAKARATFNLPDVDPDTGAGFTDATVEAAYDAFVEWAEGKVRGAESGLGSVRPTESPRASAPRKCCP